VPAAPGDVAPVLGEANAVLFCSIRMARRLNGRQRIAIPAGAASASIRMTDRQVVDAAVEE